MKNGTSIIWNKYFARNKKNRIIAVEKQLCTEQIINNHKTINSNEHILFTSK